MEVLNTDELLQVVQRIRTSTGNDAVLGAIMAKLNSLIPDTDVIVDKWPEFRALVVRGNPQKTHFFSDTVLMFMTDEDSLKFLLMTPGVVDWTRDLFFPGVTSACLPVLKEVAEKMKYSMKIRASAVTMKTTAETLKIRPIPTGLRITSLQPEQSDYLNKLWFLNRGDKTNFYIKYLISKFPSRCLYSNENEMIGFALSYHFGGLGMLYVKESHRRKGYAKIIMSHLAAMSLENDRHFFVHIEHKKFISIKLHLDIGFKEVLDSHQYYIDLWKDDQQNKCLSTV